MADRFKIYYGDESVLDLSKDDLEKAPRLNVQAIAWEDDDKSVYGVGRLVISASDYYVYVVKDEWFIQVFGEADLIDHVLHSGPVIVFKGRTIHNANYRRIYDRAREDAGLIPKQGENKRIEGGR